VVSETRTASKMSVSYVAVETKIGERARKAGHKITTRLVTDLYYFTPTNFVARLTEVLLP